MALIHCSVQSRKSLIVNQKKRLSITFLMEYNKHFYKIFPLLLQITADKKILIFFLLMHFWDLQRYILEKFKLQYPI